MSNGVDSKDLLNLLTADRQQQLDAQKDTAKAIAENTAAIEKLGSRTSKQVQWLVGVLIVMLIGALGVIAAFTGIKLMMPGGPEVTPPPAVTAPPHYTLPPMTATSIPDHRLEPHP